MKKNDVYEQAYYSFPNLVREPYDNWINIFGINTVIEMCNVFGGNEIYFPQIKHLLNEPIKASIKHEYNGDNMLYLMNKYNFSRTNIYRLISSNVKFKTLV